MAGKTVFYAWQGQLHAKTTRYLIEDALKGAIKDLARDPASPLSLTLDQDARGVTGAFEISAVILAKIDKCAMIVADVTPVGCLLDGRKTPNPNVMFELGYAWRVLREAHVIIILNKEYGEPQDLPFDIAKRGLVQYKLAEAAGTDERARVLRGLRGELRAILDRMARADEWATLRTMGLNEKDLDLFRAFYATLIEEDHHYLTYPSFVELGQSIGLNEESILDSIEILLHHGLCEAPLAGGPYRYVRVRDSVKGMHTYCEAALPHFPKLCTEVARRIVNGERSSREIAKAMGESEVLVQHIMTLLDGENYIELSKQMGTDLVVAQVKPVLRRKFQEDGPDS
jgi:hypothetical protein